MAVLDVRARNTDIDVGIVRRDVGDLVSHVGAGAANAHTVDRDGMPGCGRAVGLLLWGPVSCGSCWRS
jgi:hypothetical protein